MGLLKRLHGENIASWIQNLLPLKHQFYLKGKWNNKQKGIG